MGTLISRSQVCPSQPLAPFDASTNWDDIVETIGIVRIDVHRRLADAGAARGADHAHAPPAPHGANENRWQQLRLDRNDARAKPAEAGRAMPDVRAHVEHEIARLHERPVQRVERAVVLGIAMIDAPGSAQRAQVANETHERNNPLLHAESRTAARERQNP